MAPIPYNNFDVDVRQIKIASFNVNGIRTKIRLNAIFRSLRKSPYDIIALQETHLLKEDHGYLNRIWEGPIIHSEGTNLSKGLCILFSKYFHNKIIKILYASDRILICSYMLGEEVFYLCNIYAPNDDNERIEFYNRLPTTINRYLDEVQLARTIFLGDFNCVVDNNKDIISGDPHPVEVVKSFNTFILDTELNDIWRIDNPHDSEYTWSRPNPFIARRLDYIFVNNLLLPFLTECKIISMAHSDHRLVYCNIEFNQFRRGDGTYKMNSSLFDNPHFKETMRSLITDNIRDLATLDPITKWNVLKAKIKEFSQQFGKYNKIIKKRDESELQAQLNQLEKEYAQNTTNASLQAKILECKKKLELHNLEQTKAAMIRSKLQWMEEGEKCSKFFLSLEKSRGVNSTVFRIKDENNIEITDETEIVDVFARHFERVYDDQQNIEAQEIKNGLDKFLENVNLKQLSDDDRNMLDAPITTAELHAAFKDLNKVSSPGLDGITMQFYEIYFEDIKSTLFDYFNFCYENLELCENTQMGIISLIHKGKSLRRDEVGNWRPITLSNIDYKIIAKLLANRLKKVVGKIVGKQQQGFIKGRNIANIIRGIDDIMEYERKNNLNDLLFIIDFKQAFDKINNTYITHVFKKFGFGNNFINWISTIFSNRKSCVKNGGHVSRLFNVNCGVKQGCPIAPLLFVVASEILAQNILQDNLIKGVKNPYTDSFVKIKQFADDTSFFCQSIIDIREILSRLKEFSVFSGLNINMKKCAILFMGSNNDNAMRTIDNIEIVNKVKIVGIYFSNYNSASEMVENWEGRLAKIKSIIKLWMRRKLTIIGKIQIIKTFILSQLVYVLQSLSLPCDVLSEFNTIIYRFIWRKDNTDKRAWERVKRTILSNSKENGGLEMINLHDFQKSFLLSWACKLNSQDNDDWKMIPFYFYSHVGGKSVFNSKVEYHKFKGLSEVTSYFWAKVLRAWLENYTFKKDLSIQDNINNNELFTVQNNPLFLRNAIKKNMIYIKDILNGQDMIEYDVFRSSVGNSAECFMEYIALKLAFAKVRNLINFNKEDFDELKLNGKPISKTNRKQIYQSLLSEEECICKGFWRSKYDKDTHGSTWKNIFKYIKETKLQELQWKIVHNVYPTNTLLNRMGIKPSENCEFCGERETVEHLFFSCDRIKNLWLEVGKIILIYTKKKITLTEHIVLLGIEQDAFYSNLNDDETRLINNILVIAKQSITYSKKYDLNINIVFEKELRFRKL